MTRLEAMQILMSWRPGIDDADPQYAAALALAKTDPELSAWLDEERARYTAIRRTLKQIQIPPDLSRIIIDRRPVPIRPLWTLGKALQLAAAIAMLVGVAAYWLWPNSSNDLAHYERYVAGFASNGYRMSLESNDPSRIRTFLASNQAPADYTVPLPLERIKALGCTTLVWNGNPVLMLCFRDHPGRDLFLFVVDRQAIPNRPHDGPPTVEQVDGGYSTATWERGGKTYVLTVKGDPSVVQGYL